MMKKILITGATASQHSKEANFRNIRFSGLLQKSLESSTTSVVMASASLESIQDDYDKYIIGLAPFTSMSANKIYEALSLLNNVSDKSTVFLDAPDPHLVAKSFDSILKNPSIITKEIYRKRTGHQKTLGDKEFSDSVLGGIDKFLQGNFSVIVPSLPYFKYTQDYLKIPTNNLIELNFDSYLASIEYKNTEGSGKYWLTDSTTNSWTRKISETIANPILNVKRSHYDANVDLVDRMSSACGYLLATHYRDFPWWSANTMFALSCGIPVVSDWTHTSVMGEDWRHLPHTLESMSTDERKNLAARQKLSYLIHCPSWGEICEYSTSQIIK